MKHRLLWPLLVLPLLAVSVRGQEKRPVSLPEAVNLAMEQSHASKLADTKVLTAESELHVMRNNMLPDLSVSGQYMRLSNADVNLKFASGGEDDSEGGDSGSSPSVNQLLLGQASAGMPLFSGFKLTNSLKSSKNHLEATRFSAENQKERIALEAISEYVELYKAQQSVSLIQENLKSAQQRVKDFDAMEQNGILARNDLLKAQLQESNVLLALEQAKKDRTIINQQLVSLLQLPAGTTIEPDTTNITSRPGMIGTDSLQRKDLASLEYEQKAAEDRVKVEKAAYFPSISLSGGYIALDVHNALTVTNAINVGVGVSYDLANIFKSGANIKLAKSKAQEVNEQVLELQDQIDIQLANAQQEYSLAEKKLEVYQKSKEQAQENYRIVKDKYDNGLVDTNDLLEADLDQLQAKINLSNAQADLTLKYYQLIGTKGMLSSLFNNN